MASIAKKFCAVLLGFVASSFFYAQAQMAPPKNGDATPADARTIAKDAYIYAYSMLFNYKTMYEQAIDGKSKAFTGGFGKFRHYSEPYGPQNKDIVTPNNDTPYSWAWLDLRSEPWVLTVPEVKDNRYYVFQLVDLYTYNFAYVGSRATGNAAGHYLIAGPSWKGEVPKGIDKVFRAETDIVMMLGRTALNGPSDVKNVQAIQKAYQLTPLSQFALTTTPPAASHINFPKWDEAKATSIDFISYLNFLLQFTQPVVPSERDLMARFAKIGIAPGKSFDAASLSPALRQAIEAGVADGKEAMAEAEKRVTSSSDLFGSRQDLGSDYMKRAIAAAMGIYGNTKEEAVYIGTLVDGDKKQLVGTQPYVLHFDKKDLTPARFFWSITMYDLPGRHLVANPIKRYSIGDRTPGVKFGADGSLDIYVQHDSPGPDLESNWLPAPAGPYTVIMRIYGPDQAVLNGEWKFPVPVKR